MSPVIVILFTGKRKSGKDYLTDRLHQILGSNVCSIIKISQPIKSHWAKCKGLSLERLLGDGEYKELYRLEMIKWSEEMRDKDYGCFCKLACEHAKPAKVWIVSDIRRRTDLTWFRENYGSRVVTVKVTADERIRLQRGLVFTKGVDDAPSECDLDGLEKWDYLIDNSYSSDNVEDSLSDLLNVIKMKVTE